MPKATAKADIRYEFDAKPEPGQTLPVGDGTAWLRMPLPFALNHINLWILRDTGGWAVVDTGLGDDASRAHWQALFVSTLKNEPVKRVLVTHMHPDHVGCAGFLTEAFDAPLWMTREEYLYCRVLVADTGRAAPAEGIAFYRAAGYPEAALERYRRMFGYFGRYVTSLPESYHRLRDGQRLAIDGSDWEVIVGRGHSPEHACLYNADSGLLIGGFAKQKTPMGEIEAVTEFSDYKDFNGIKQPTKVTLTMMGQQQVMEFTSYEYGPMDAAVFTVPAPVATLISQKPKN